GIRGLLYLSAVTRLPVPNNDAAVETNVVFPMGDDDQLTLRRLFAVLRHRIILIAGVSFLITSLAALFVFQITPRYRSEAQIVVEGSKKNVSGVDSLVQGLQPDFWTNETEAAVIGSRELGRKVVEKLNLQNNPAFNPELRKPRTGLWQTLVEPLRTFVGDVMVNPLRDALFASEPSEDGAQVPVVNLTAEEKREHELDRLTSAYLGGLSVLPQDRSRVLTITYTSHDREFAALAANASAEAYILDQLSTKGEATSRASKWLSERVNEMRRRVIESEQRLEEFRKTAGIVEVGGATLYQQQLVAMNEELAGARNKRAEAEARYDQVQAIMNAGGNPTSVAAVLDNRVIQGLRDQEATLERKVQDLTQQFLPSHPKLRQAQTEMQGLQSKIAAEVERITANLGNELKLSRTREQNVIKEAKRLEELFTQQREAEVSLRSLESEARANKQLYETLLTRFKETNVQRDEVVQQADARIISRATVTSYPFYPQRSLMIAAAFIVSLVIGIGIALIIEYLDSGFRSLNQIEAMTGQPTIGLVPALADLQKQGKRAHEIAVERPNSAFGEAIRTLRTALLLSRVDSPPKTVLLTSSVPGEGKTSTALSLAVMAARSAQKAIIVDCDLRHSTLHTYLDHPNHLGLGDYLAGLATLEDVIEIDPRSGVHFITGGNRAPNPTDLLGSQEMRKLLKQLSQIYDLVVLDTPPLLAVSDALVLVRHVDKSIYLVRWEKTRREAVMSGLKLLIESGANLAGVLLTQVDMRKHAQYDYADSGYYYYGNYKNYYTE
ncbi:MAG: GumC family protein, partial [Alphaproteobacteria bacterium]